MKRLVVVLSMGVMILLPSCSKDKPTAPKGDDYKLIESGTVGSGGGTFGNEDFSLIVPAGAFSSDAQLELYVSTSDRPFGENGVTYTYQLEGMPSDFSQPLTIRLKYRGTLMEESFIAVGKKELIIDLDVEEVFYRLYPAADSSGYLIGQLPATQADGLLRGGRTWRKIVGPQGEDESTLRILGVDKYAIQNSEHFELLYPKYLITIRDDLLSAFEEFVDIFEALFFEQVTCTMVLEVFRFDVAPEMYARCPWLYPYEKYMAVNESHLTPAELPEIKREAGSEYLKQFLDHLWDYEYDRYSHWLGAAIGLWAEEKLVTTAGHVPPRFRGREMVPFTGIRGGVWSGVTNRCHGYGMSAVIKCLVDDPIFGEDGLLRTHVYIETHKPDVLLDGLIASIYAPVNQWWPDFFRRYVGGDIYGVEPDVFVTNAADVFHTSSDRSIQFYGSLYDLSARIYLVDLNDRDVSEDDKLRFAVSSPTVSLDDLTALVFGLKDSQLEFLGAGSEMIVDDLKGLTDGGWDLLAVVVNSHHQQGNYLGKSDVYLNVERLDASMEYDCWMSLHGRADFRFQHPGYEDNYYTSSISWMFPPGGTRVHTGSLSEGNVFSDVMQWTTELGTTLRESVWVDLDHDMGSVEAFYVELKTEGVSTKYHFLLSGTELPKVLEDTRYLEYAVQDEMVFQKISAIQYTMTDLGTGAVTTLLQPVSGTEQYMKIGFEKP